MYLISIHPDNLAYFGSEHHLPSLVIDHYSKVIIRGLIWLAADCQNGL